MNSCWVPKVLSADSWYWVVPIGRLSWLEDGTVNISPWAVKTYNPSTCQSISSAKYPTWSVTTTRKNFLARVFPLPDGATGYSRPLAVSRRASMRSHLLVPVIASCRAWFTASVLRVENGFFLPVAVGLGGRGISSSVCSASPQWGCVCCLWVSW